MLLTPKAEEASRKLPKSESKVQDCNKANNKQALWKLKITMRQYCGNMPMEITKSEAWVHVSVPEMLRNILAFHANILQLDDAYSCIKCRLQGHIYDLQTKQA